MSTEAAVLTGGAAVASWHYLARRDLAAQVFNAATQWWLLLDKDHLAQSWVEDVRPGMIAVVEAGQRIAAEQANPYIDALDREWEIVGAPDHKVDRWSFVGTGVSGRTLDDLLDRPMVVTRRLLSGGLDFTSSLTAGLYSAQRITVNEVQSAGNEADQALATAREYEGGYRVLNLPCCARCAVLAGKFYRWDAGFLRHPNCDCTYVPTRDDLGEVGSDQWDLDDAIASGQITGLSQADIDAITNEGASVSRIVGRQVSGMSYARGRHGNRKTVADIYRIANGDRSEAVRLLIKFGYIVRT